MRTHTVQSGETLIVVARRYGVESMVLAQTNQLKAPYALRSGQVLVLPGSAIPETTAIALRETTSPTMPPPTPASTPLPAPMPPQAPTPVIIESAPPAPAPAPREVAPSVVVPPPSPAPSSPPRESAASSEPPTSPVLSAPPPRSGRSFMWPVRGNVVSGFGPKSGGLQNDGINIAAPRGTAVRAAESGVVVYTGNDLRGFGNLLLLRHADGWMTAYAHLESIGVQRGQTVSRGQVVGRVGQTGAVTSPQLHFEVRRGTRPVDPRGQLGSLVAAAN
jgi:murein DD-endopeptidase MepM/ murein hydrolase activator NlpD